jgi:hypothetical protein
MTAGDDLARRLRVFQTLANQARERDESEIVLPPQALWEPSDQAALDIWDAAKAEAMGLSPLFPGGH